METCPGICWQIASMVEFIPWCLFLLDKIRCGLSENVILGKHLRHHVKGVVILVKISRVLIWPWAQLKLLCTGPPHGQVREEDFLYVWEGKGNFWFHFRLFIQFLALCSMDKKAEAEPKIALAKYYHSSSSFGNFLFSIVSNSSKLWPKVKSRLAWV